DRRRREEAELDAAYADAHASILASLFDLLADVLRALPDVQLAERPRMADFARVLAAVDKVQGWNTLDSYKATARDAVADVLDGEPFAQAVVALVDRAGADGLTLTTSELLERVPAPDKLPRKWPKDATRAGGQLKRLAPVLRTIGIEVDDSKRTPDAKRKRLYHLTALPERRYETASAASATGQDTGSDQGKQGGRWGVDASVRNPGAPDAADAAPDAARSAASGVLTLPDRREHQRADAADAADAEMHPLSTDARPKTPCAHCTRPQWNAEGSPLCLDCRTAA
ncbi:ATP-binding protein, partial [Streptomyces sp. KR55]